MDPAVKSEYALQIALDDARQVYADMSVYRPEIRLEDGRWRVVFVFKNPEMQGGGPSYVISSDTGEILEKAYGQ